MFTMGEQHERTGAPFAKQFLKQSKQNRRDLRHAHID